MPSGRVHNLINTLTFAGLGVAAAALYARHVFVPSPAQALYFSVGYLVGTFLLSPDLDLAEGHVDAKRRWGPLGFLWAGYGMLFSHRGLSHTWLLGPLTRLGYLGGLAALTWGLLHALLPGTLPAVPLLRVPREVLASPVLSHHLLGWGFLYPLLIGYYLSQWLHLAADGIRPDHGLRRGSRKLRGAARRFR